MIVLADEDGRAALRCIRCSACLNVCPVYERAGGYAYSSVYPGPIGPQLTGVEEDPSLPFASTLCGACFDACPVAIDIPTMLVHLRGRAVQASRGGRAERAAMAAMAWLMGSERRWTAGLRAARAARLLSRRGTIRSLPPPLSAWTRSRDLPVPPRESFRDWWRDRS